MSVENKHCVNLSNPPITATHKAQYAIFIPIFVATTLLLVAIATIVTALLIILLMGIKFAAGAMIFVSWFSKGYICFILTTIATLAQSIIAGKHQAERSLSNNATAHCIKYKNTYWCSVPTIMIHIIYSFVAFGMLSCLILLVPILLYTMLALTIISGPSPNVTRQQQDVHEVDSQ
jgi:hypothetical protein